MTSGKNEQAGLTESSSNEFAELLLGEIALSGDSTAEFEGGLIEVFGGIPGERVTARIHRYRRRKQSIVAGMVVEVLTPSVHRVEAPCPYYGPCSGCQWQHIDYRYQLALKRDQIKRAFSLHPGLEEAEVADTIASPDQLGYRNHARLTVRRGGVLGFVNRVTRRFVQIDRCLLMAKGINDIVDRLAGTVAETTQLSVRYGVNTDEWLIQPTMKGELISIPTGQTHYRERLTDRTFRVASPSFFQVNTRQAEVLGDLVLKRMELTGSETIVDAYAGVGTFAVLFAPYVSRVIAIEESSAAVKDAAVNVGQIDNIEFIEAKTEDALIGLPEPPDGVVLDPPRIGCQASAIEATVATGAKRIVYVSCDPTALARDLKLLIAGGYRLIRVEPLDMFPQTHHVECVATLDLDV